MKQFVTSESVTEGHPDKICDKISDKILDTALEQDENSKMAVECTIKDDLVFIYGECNTKAKLNYQKIAQEVLKEIGYQEKFKVIIYGNKIDILNYKKIESIKDDEIVITSDNKRIYATAITFS